VLRAVVCGILRVWKGSVSVIRVVRENVRSGVPRLRVALSWPECNGSATELPTGLDQLRVVGV
jgi:hypothetical protein